MGKEESKNKIYKYITRSLTSRSMIVSLILIVASVILPYVVGVLGLNISGDLVYSFSSAFATAGIVSVLYNYITLEETKELIAETLMLNSEVQQEVLREEKIEQLLDTSLDNVIGNQLKIAIKRTLLDNIKKYKDTTRHAYTLSVTLKSLKTGHELKQSLPEVSQYLERAFYSVELISKFHEILPPTIQEIKLVATSEDSKYPKIVEEIFNEDKTLLYVYYLPGGLGSVLEKYREIIGKNKELQNKLISMIFDIKDFKVSNYHVENITKNLLFNKKGVTVEISLKLSRPQGTFKSNAELVQIDYQITSILSKFENVFYQEFLRPYSSLDIWFDYTYTDVIWAEPYISFTSAGTPTVQRSTDTKKIHIFIDEWVLPHSMVVFVLQRDECGLIKKMQNAQSGYKACREFYKWAFEEVKNASPKYNLEWITELEGEM